MPVISFMLVILLWDLLARYSGWSAAVFPGPVIVLKGIAELLSNGTLLRHTVASLFRVTAGFYLAVVFGIPLGIVIGRSVFMHRLIHPLL